MEFNLEWLQFYGNFIYEIKYVSYEIIYRGCINVNKFFRASE